MMARLIIAYATSDFFPPIAGLAASNSFNPFPDTIDRDVPLTVNIDNDNDNAK
ncbi:hypothetical protein [Marinibacterium profundimaris]|uniref:hypothetical protein n=1 Tax=Marinibacterium profundimaris TaxID=1679460 RepID=UPI001303408E|nr:hypothetical protein [Marinibacterium profundimaris]